MNRVSTAYVDSGRTNQKQRTREALLAAARSLIEGGDTPRVEDVARESGISRTTAYRYFPTQTELLAAAFPETAAASMLPDPAPDDVALRVDAVVPPHRDRRTHRASAARPCSGSRSAPTSTSSP